MDYISVEQRGVNDIVVEVSCSEFGNAAAEDAHWSLFSDQSQSVSNQ